MMTLVWDLMDSLKKILNDLKIKHILNTTAVWDQNFRREFPSWVREFFSRLLVWILEKCENSRLPREFSIYSRILYLLENSRGLQDVKLSRWKSMRSFLDVYLSISLAISYVIQIKLLINCGKTKSASIGRNLVTDLVSF